MIKTNSNSRATSNSNSKVTTNSVSKVGANSFPKSNPKLDSKSTTKPKIKSTPGSTQRALAYCIYMMVAGNFSGCYMVNPCMDKKLLLELKSQNEKEQIRLEDEAARLADKFFLKKLPKGIWKESPRAVIEENPITGMEVTFLGSKWKLRILGLAKKGRKAKFLYQFSFGESHKTP